MVELLFLLSLQIGDFGLAKLCPRYKTHMDTLVRGTEG